MSYIPNDKNTEVTRDAGGRSRIATMTTLFDGKTLNQDDTLLWENVGTGTATFSNNAVKLGVSNGQYMIRRGRHTLPYFSGKSTIMEITFDNFAVQTGVTKRVGYFSSSAVAPYDTFFDGFFLENDGATISLKVSNDGKEVATIPLANWDNAQYFAGYNWDNFTIVLFDFLWLGGSELRMFIKTVDGFVLAHTYKHASTTVGTFIKSPNQSIRYEIRGVSGAGTFNTICSQVSTEGAVPDDGKSIVLHRTGATGIATNAVGTIYALIGVKKTPANRDISVAIQAVAVANTAVSDTGLILVILNPTLSAPLTYTNKSKISEGTATNQTVIANTGRVLAAVPSGATGQAGGLNNTILAQIGMSIANVSDEIVLAYMATSATQAVYGALTIKEY